MKAGRCIYKQIFFTDGKLRQAATTLLVSSSLGRERWSWPLRAALRGSARDDPPSPNTSAEGRLRRVSRADAMDSIRSVSIPEVSDSDGVGSGWASGDDDEEDDEEDVVDSSDVPPPLESVEELPSLGVPGKDDS